jgi:hypothetical protein
LGDIDLPDYHLPEHVLAEMVADGIVPPPDHEPDHEPDLNGATDSKPVSGPATVKKGARPSGQV